MIKLPRLEITDNPAANQAIEEIVAAIERAANVVARPPIVIERLGTSTVIGYTSKPPYVIGKSSGTISARSGTTPGSGSVVLYFDNSGTLTASGETITVKNLSSTATSSGVWVGCAYDGIDYWLDWEDCG